MTSLLQAPEIRTSTSSRSVDRVRSLGYDDFIEHYVIPRRPVILEEAISFWPALHKWTPDFWRERYGDRTIEIDGKSLPLRDLIRMALESNVAAPAPYYRNIPMRRTYPELLPDISPAPECSTPNWFHSKIFLPIRDKIAGGGGNYELFIGGAGRSFPYLHFDSPGAHTFIYQICGRKAFILFEPSDGQFLYHGQDVGFSVSEIPNVENVDLEKYPLFAKATRIDCEIGPGDTLFMPCGWWHTARMLSFSIGLGIDVANQSNWDDVMSYMARKAANKNPLLALGYMSYMRIAGIVMPMISNL
ncbi:MAG TPA: cupin-like domain-containing protein [Verrucomicrobiota bacterium]|nr:cupin-like domain-containing protein [Verrucomicrobiota bacterium]